MWKMWPLLVKIIYHVNWEKDQRKNEKKVANGLLVLPFQLSVLEHSWHLCLRSHLVNFIYFGIESWAVKKGSV